MSLHYLDGSTTTNIWLREDITREMNTLHAMLGSLIKQWHSRDKVFRQTLHSLQMSRRKYKNEWLCVDGKLK